MENTTILAGPYSKNETSNMNGKPLPGSSGAKTNVAYITMLTLVATLGGLLFGYDTGVISGAIDNVRDHFGLSEAMKAFVASSALLACIFGAGIAGPLSKSYGRRMSLVVASVLFFISAFGSAIPTSVTELVIYRMIGGVGVGIASMVSPMYIAEIAPPGIRGKLVSFNQLAIVLGFVIVYFVNYFIDRVGDDAWDIETGWRWMFGSECFPAGLFLLLLLAVPESPRWLVMKGKSDKAHKVLTKVGGLESVDNEIKEIQNSIAEQSQRARVNIFAKGLIGIVFIGVGLSVFQQITGINAILYYGPSIFESTGMAKDGALLNQIVVGISMMTFTFVAIFTVDKFGRKPLLMIGSLGMAISIFAVGFLFYFEVRNVLTLVFIVTYIASFSLSMGPVVWVLLSEMFPNKMRSAALSAAVAAQWLANYLVSQTFPILADDQGTLYAQFHGAFPFWLFGAFAILCVLFIKKYVPETKGKSLEELEKIWGQE